MRVATGDEYLDLALVDVEGFVGEGVPRHAFVLLPVAGWSSTDVPRFRLASSTLVALGWEVDHAAGIMRPPDRPEIELSLPHPYELGPIWSGANCWRAEFRVATTEVVGLVDHRWAGRHGGLCEPGEELISGSPWYWHVLRSDAGSVCGRAETPVLAAFAAESVLIDVGADVPARTRLRRALT